MKSAAISITELLTLNTVKHSRKRSNAVRHNVDRETRLPLYLGFLVYNKTRKQDLIDTLFQRRLSVSCDIVLQLSTDIANDQYEDDGVVCPTILRKRLFTTGNLDNLNHNPTFYISSFCISRYCTVNDMLQMRIQASNVTRIDRYSMKKLKDLKLSSHW